jgi:hypothetical protein
VSPALLGFLLPAKKKSPLPFSQKQGKFPHRPTSSSPALFIAVIVVVMNRRKGSIAYSGITS